MSRSTRDRKTSSSPSASPKKPRPRRKPSPPAAKAGERVTSPRNVHLGDVLKVERRYVVDGALTSVTDQGEFKGVQVLGSTEHLLLEDGKNKDVRMIPLHTISEIVIVGSSPARVRPENFDPSFA